MAEDRERLFEKALLRHLRADAPGESLCLDPEALAAYYERLLSPQEAAAVKSHLDSCARCQEILAQLESSEGRSELGEDKEMVALGAAVAPTPEKVKPIARRKPFSLGLVLPVGAVAAGLLLWIGISVFRTRPGSMAPSAQVAVNRSEPEVPKPDFEPQKQLDQLSPSPAEGKRKDAPLYDLSEARKPDSLREYSRRAAVPPAGRDKAEAQLQARASDLKGPPPRPATGRAAEEVEAASEADTLDAAQTTAQSAKSDVARPAGGALAPVPAPAPRSDAPSTAQPSAAPTAKKSAANNNISGSAVLNAVATLPGLDIQIAAPGGQKIWRVGERGQILYSKDGGRTWMAQSTGVSEALTSGFAPSDEVCWVAGVAGTLLRTTDGGQHWQRVRTPISSNLGGVHAADAQRASIWDVGNRSRYETADGGSTWKPTANE